MSNLVKQNETELRPEERALLLGDLSKLSPEQRSDLYVKVCNSLGLNPLTNPFNYISLSGKLVLYATRNCTDQLRSIKGVSVQIQSREVVEDLYIVTARATLPSGRCDESIGAVPLGNLKGEARANTIMKCETKAKRRVTLSICGLSYMDETEVETIQGATVVSIDKAHSIEAPKPVNPIADIPLDEFPPDDEAILNTFSEDPINKTVKIGQSTAGKKFSEIPEAKLIEMLNWSRKTLEANPKCRNALDIAEFQCGATAFLKSMGVEL